MAPGATLDLNKIRVFVVVVENGSLTAAARKLGLPTSSVSRAMTALERSLGVRLLHRSPRSTRLTSAGSSYYDAVRPALGDLERAQSRLRQDASSLSGSIRLTASPVVAAGLLAPLVVRFRRDHPAVTFDIVATSAVVDLAAEQIDLAVRLRRVTGPHLTARRIGQTAPKLFASPAYLTSRGTPARIGDLRTHDGVVFRGRGRPERWRLLTERGAIREAQVRSAIACDDYAVVRHVVLEGGGIGVVPAFFARADVASGRLVAVLPHLSLEPVPVWLASPSRPRDQSERVLRFKQLIVAELAAQGAR